MTHKQITPSYYGHVKNIGSSLVEGKTSTQQQTFFIRLYVTMNTYVSSYGERDFVAQNKKS